MNRREFMTASAAALAAAVPARPAKLPVQKGVIISMLPTELSLADRMKVARDVGFDVLECVTTPDQEEADAIKTAAEKAGLRIHSVMNMAHWKFPLSSSDPSVVKTSMEGMETSLKNAHFWGADAVLLVPAVVNPQTSYQDAWTRSQRQIRQLLPMAEDLKIVIAVEEVWNKFLLSPLEFARYVDEFNSPWVRAYFDVGNVVLYGYPQDWIRTLGKRIIKVHLKDFSFTNRVAKFVPLKEGEIQWGEVHKALAEIDFSGPATVELNGGDEAYLREVSRRVDAILSGA